MKHTVPALLGMLLLMAACKNNPATTDAPPATKDSAAEAQQSFFPVPEYIGGQLRIIDSLQLPLSKTVTVKNRSTQAVSSDKELRAWARYFQEPDISDSSVKKMYTETNIADQTVPSVTLIYSTGNSALPVQKINVFIQPSANQNDQVTGIYIEKMFTVQDTVFNQKLYWKTGKNMQVITEKKIKGVTLPVEQVKITWDPSS